MGWAPKDTHQTMQFDIHEKSRHEKYRCVVVAVDRKDAAVLTKQKWKWETKQLKEQVLTCGFISDGTLASLVCKENWGQNTSIVAQKQNSKKEHQEAWKW